MNVFVICEFSGIVRDAFTRLGHNAISIDLLPSESPGKHVIGDVCTCSTDTFPRFDLAICFPPCTYLCTSGARWWNGRQQEQKEALKFVQWLMDLPIPKIALENPIGKISTSIRPPDQIIQPWMFGHGETKATCLWLKGLSPLIPANIVEGREPRVHYMSKGPDRWANRSRTLLGIANAMAEQWGNTPS